MRGRTTFPTSASAWECRPRASNLPATSADCRGANSSEFDPATPHRVIYKLRELLASRRWAGRCGWALGPASWSRIRSPPGLQTTGISERHRHRYEFNREYETLLTSAGLRSPARRRMQPTWRLSSCPATRSFWAASFTPSSSRSRLSRTPCFRALSPRHTTAGCGAQTATGPPAEPVAADSGALAGRVSQTVQ